MRNWEIRKNEIISRYGEWWSYNILENNGGFYLEQKRLGEDPAPLDGAFIGSIVNIARDFIKKP